MTTPCQRWRDGAQSFVRMPARLREFDVASIDRDTAPKAFVEQHHYSGSFPAAIERFGLYRFGELVGVVVFSEPCNTKVLTNVFPDVPTDFTMELGRLVLLDEVGFNAGSYFVARCFEHLRSSGYKGIVSFSDPVPRRSRTGEIVMPGHVGTVYQALNARYLGRSTVRTLRLFPDGTVFSSRTAQKVRAQETGWEGAVETLLSYGAPPLDEDPRAWLRRVLPLVTSTMRHPGNHKYAWALDRHVQLPPRIHSYPKKAAA